MKTPFLLLLLVTLLLACLGLSSCAALGSAITGQPIPTTPVTRAGGKPFQVATADVLRAEASPEGTAWGLYDAGMVAARAREVIDTGK